MAPPRKKPVMIGRSTRVTKTPKAPTCTIPAPSTPLPTALPPSRNHQAAYHYPLLFDDTAACDALLAWFKSVEETRSMPWRKTWLDPKDFEGKAEELGQALGRRAYEVWVSEVMLQQTRVSTVIPYFNNWISKWPTVQDLAGANHDDVLAAWKGLGYYSRATRLHEGAKAMIAKSADSACPLPSKAIDLQEFPGIGRYTAGAVSSIVFGESEPVLDGNVIRVLSRQLGFYMDSKDKKATDVLWEEADRLIKYVSGLSGTGVSATPGQWNQALMELGSTVCTPTPQCADCPIQTTCRVYSEGQVLSAKRQLPAVTVDIEDACTLCDQLDTEDLAIILEKTADGESSKPTKKRKGNEKQSNTISQYFAIGKSDTKKDDGEEIAVKVPQPDTSHKRKASQSDALPAPNIRSTTMYCSLFPKKVAKKKATEDECVVCVIEVRSSTGKSKWLIQQRPAKGLLASLWQFPQCSLSTPATTPASRKATSQTYVSSLGIGDPSFSEAVHVAAFPPLVHVFTHIRLTMHVHQFRITCDNVEDVFPDDVGPPAMKWVEAESMSEQTLSTGMRKCWDLIAKAA